MDVEKYNFNSLWIMLTSLGARGGGLEKDVILVEVMSIQ